MKLVPFVHGVPQLPSNILIPSFFFVCRISSPLATYTTPAELCLHSHCLTMCLATVETCGHCRQEFCCALNICAEAKRLGMIHLAKSIPDTHPAIQIAHPQTDIHFLKVYPVMEQERIQVLRCSHCDGMSGLKPGPLRAEEAQQQHATNELANALDAYFGFDVHRK